MFKWIAGAAALACMAGTAAHAEVAAVSDAGFVVREAVDVTAGADQVWARLIRPSVWWSGKHTYSGDSANLSLDAMAGGCFCEVLPSVVSPRAAPRGSVEHMRVAYAEEPRVLRMIGALGPLQSEAVHGTLTIALKPIDGGTRIMWEYVVGGYMRQRTDQMAPVVDAVLSEQLSRLAGELGVRPAPAVKAGPAPQPTSPPKSKAPVEGR